jgi:hypothetical protein
LRRIAIIRAMQAKVNGHANRLWTHHELRWLQSVYGSRARRICRAPALESQSSRQKPTLHSKLVSRSPEFHSRSKQGFSSALPYILENDYRGMHSRYVENSQLVQQGVLAPGPIQQLLEEHLTGRVDHGNRDSQRKIFGKTWIIADGQHCLSRIAVFGCHSIKNV